jgi:hypothetical protein
MRQAWGSFRSPGKPNDVTLVPFYKLFGERYAIYWEFPAPGGQRRRGDPPGS